MRPPAVSVLVPCYNAGPYLADALASALGQIRRPAEILLVDDGSTDGAAASAAGLAGVRYVRRDNGGAAAARNTAWRLAVGDYIGFLDADDLWEPRAVERLAAPLDNDAGLDAVVGMTQEFLSPEIELETRPERLAQGPVRARLLGAILVRRSVFDAIGGFDEVLPVGEAIDWLSRFIHAGLKMQEIDDLVLRRRIHRRNMTIGQLGDGRNYLPMLRAAARRRAATLG